MNAYIHRHLEAELSSSSKLFPAIVLNGPRQAGKTTLLNKLHKTDCKYVSLDEPDTLLIAQSNPRGFMNTYKPPVIFDEIQQAPHLLPYIKNAIDRNRDRKGQYYLSGSQNLLLLSSVTESLAGRCSISTLLPLSIREQLKVPLHSAPWDGIKPEHNSTIDAESFWQFVVRGGFPELCVNEEIPSEKWFSSYIRNYLERDIRSIRNVANLTQFQVFIRLLAARSGQLLQLTSIATDVGVSIKTVKEWISLLEATHQIIIVRPYFVNIGKRLIKQPKIYFTDTGLLCYLVGLSTVEHAMAGPMSGVLVETAVLTELYKRFYAQGIEPRIYFYRTSHGVEVDFIVELRGKLIPIEVKQTATPTPSMAKSMLTFLDDYPKVAKQGWIVNLGEGYQPVAKNVTAIPFTAL